MIHQSRVSRPLQYHHVLAIGLVFFTFFMVALVSRTVFERLPHLEDELAYLYQAKIFEHGHLVIDIPMPQRAYWQPFVVDFAPTGERFGKYTPGWPALLAVGVNVGQPWIVNAFLAAMTVALTYRLGREIFNPDAGVIAAALTAFSPMALLLNATLMGHTSALFFTTLFMYAYWRMERRAHAIRWGVVAGAALGMVVISRPLTALGIAAPFVLWSGLRLILSLIRRQSSPPVSPLTALVKTLRPLLALGIVAAIISAAIPVFNRAATGDPSTNLYTLIWPYDRVGFGTGFGRHGHTLEKGLRQTRWDLSLTAADLFGWQMSRSVDAVSGQVSWQLGTFTDEVKSHLLNDGDYYPNVGLSFFLLPFGLLAGFRRRWALIWLVVAIGWLLRFDAAISANQNSRFTMLLIWSLFGGFWLLAALVMALWRAKDRAPVWTWLLLAAPVCLIAVHVAYWIGSQRYSTRYYFEGLTALAILSALPLAWLARRWRWPVYAGVAALLIYSLYAYSTPRISLLYRFNRVGQDVIRQVEARAQRDTPILVIVAGSRENTRWRALGSLMAITSPYLDSPIVAAWDYAPDDDNVRQQILARFPDRQVIDMDASGDDAWFVP